MESEPISSIKDIERRFVAWAKDEEPIRAAFVIGSQARTDHPADRWSDLDIILFAKGIEAYKDSTDWIATLGPVWIALGGQTVAGDPERLVLFEGGLQVDFVFHEAMILPGFREMVAAGEVPDTVRRGMRVLLDKDNLLLVPEPSRPPAPAPPSEEAFRGWYDGFWFGAVHIAKQMAQGDLLAFKGGEAGLRNQLLPLMEWHARATHEGDIDTWHGGRFLEEWADPRVYAALKETYTPFNAAASWRGFLALLEMVRWVGDEIAERSGFAFPIESHERAYQFILGLSVEVVKQ